MHTDEETPCRASKRPTRYQTVEGELDSSATVRQNISTMGCWHGMNICGVVRIYHGTSYTYMIMLARVDWPIVWKCLVKCCCYRV